MALEAVISEHPINQDAGLVISKQMEEWVSIENKHKTVETQ